MNTSKKNALGYDYNPILNTISLSFEQIIYPTLSTDFLKVFDMDIFEHLDNIYINTEAYFALVLDVCHDSTVFESKVCHSLKYHNGIRFWKLEHYLDVDANVKYILQVSKDAWMTSTQNTEMFVTMNNMD